MRTILRKLISSLALWTIVFAALVLLFHRFAPTDAEALADERTSLTVLTENGPVEMTMAEYLPHAVAAEMPVSFGPEALRAQAVAARTYAVAAHKHENADVCTDSACCLAYLNEDELRAMWTDAYDKNLAAITAAVADTDGEILTYGGQAIQAVFHASSAGSTEASAAVWSALPYLVSVSSPETAESVPELVSTARFTADELYELLGLDADAPSGEAEPETELDDAGRVRRMSVAGQTFSGCYVRAALGLASTDFSVSRDGTDYVFTVLGRGHGVGMSQVGAKLLAADGMTYAEILAHYYPGTELGQLP